jgi:phage anti-repressor protein
MNELGGFDAFVTYHALKLHFNGKYDYVKYNGKTNVSKDQFINRKDKFSFYKLSRKYNKEEIFGFFLSNLLNNPNVWAGDLLQDDADQVFKKWLRTQQSLSYMFKQNIDHLFDLVEMPEDMLKVVAGQYPLLYNEHLQGKISIETIIILNDIMNFFPMWKKKVTDDIIFPGFLNRCEKYKPFLNYDKTKFKHLIKEKICQTA